VARVIYSADALGELERIIEHLLEHAAQTAASAIDRIQSAIEILQDHPEIGRRVDSDRRELVISRGATGYLALYRYDAGMDLVRILRIRHQREAGYRG
jgi:plasmid stabilization system protein ParE